MKAGVVAPEFFQVWFWDETGFSLRVIRRKARVREASPIRLYVNAGHFEEGDKKSQVFAVLRRIPVMGGLRYHDRKNLSFFVKNGDGESFFESLEKLNKFIKAEWTRQGNKDELYERIGSIILVVLDNASYHKRQDILERIAQLLPNIHFCFLPAYSPDFNLIELVWHSCKARWGDTPPSRLYAKSSLLIGYLSQLTNFKKS